MFLIQLEKCWWMIKWWKYAISLLKRGNYSLWQRNLSNENYTVFLSKNFAFWKKVLHACIFLVILWFVLVEELKECLFKNSQCKISFCWLVVMIPMQGGGRKNSCKKSGLEMWQEEKREKPPKSRSVLGHGGAILEWQRQHLKGFCTLPVIFLNSLQFSFGPKGKHRSWICE